MIGGLEGFAGGRFVRSGGTFVFNAGGIICQVMFVFDEGREAGTEFVNDHSCGGASVGDSQPATKNSSAKLKMTTANLNTRIFCGRKNRTQAVSGKKESQACSPSG